jgi:hypothetical protein
VYVKKSLGPFLNTIFFERVLGLRWPCLELKDASKIWVGLGIPCSETDMNLFYATTMIKVGNGKKAPFLEAPWLNGAKPKRYGPSCLQNLKEEEMERKLSP